MAKSKFLIKGDKPEDHFIWGGRINDIHNLWIRSDAPFGSCDTFLSPYLLETLATLDAEFYKSAKAYGEDTSDNNKQKLEKEFFRVLTDCYFRHIIRETRKVLPEVLDYFVAKAITGSIWQDDVTYYTSEIKDP